MASDSFQTTPIPSIELDPSDSLQFVLVGNSSPQSILTIRNTSQVQCTAFKVKTTQPKRYLVRPNQGVIKCGESAKVVVILQQKDAEELLHLDLNDRRQCNDKFLVQSTLMDRQLAASLELREPKEYADILTALWIKQEKGGIYNKKLRCRFVDGTKIEKQPILLTNHGEQKRVDVERVRDATTKPVDSFESLTSNHQDKFSEAATLRKKYDELVSFTVQLTAQRDTLIGDLDKANRHVEKYKIEAENAKVLSSDLRHRKTRISSMGGPDAAKEEAEQASVTQKPFGLFHILVTALIFFLVGRYAK